MRQISPVTKCFNIFGDHAKQKQTPKGVKKVTKCRMVQSRDRAVTETEKKFPSVSEEEDERQEAELM